MSENSSELIFLKNGPIPVSFCIFSVFSNKQYIFYNKSMLKKSCPSSIQYQDLNPRPSEHETPPITTRPGLLPRRNQHSILKAGFELSSQPTPPIPIAPLSAYLTDRDQGARQLTGDEVFYMSNCQINLIIVLHALLLFCKLVFGF